MATTPKAERGRQPRFRPGMSRNALTKIRFDRNLRGEDIANAAGVRAEIIQRIERGAGKGLQGRGKVARNHPAIPAIAKAYGVPVATLAPFLGPASDYWGTGAAPKHTSDHTPATVPHAVTATKGRTGPQSPLVALRFAKGLTVTSLAKKAGVDRKLIAHIETMRGTVRPDFPSLPRIAKAYGVAVETIATELRAHYVAPTSSAATVTVTPHANAGKRDPVRVSSDAGPLAHRRAEFGLTVRDVEQRADTGTKIIQDLERGRLPVNHPYIPHLAPIYKLSVEDLRAYCTAPAMSDKYVMKLTTQRENRHRDKRALKKNTAKADTLPKGVRLMHVPTTEAPTNGKRVYNKLTRVTMPVRQLVRALVSDLNVRIMEGAKEVVLPPIPIGTMRDFVGDYLKAKGIDATMLLDPHFAEHFD